MNSPDVAADLHKRLSQICDAVEFNTSQDTNTLTFAGTRVDALADDTYSTPIERQTNDALTLALRNTLYQRCYAFLLPGLADNRVCEQPPTLRVPYATQTDDVTTMLSAANQGTTCWDQNWAIEAITTDGQYIAVKNNTRRTVWPGEFVCAQGSGQPPMPGALVNLQHLHEAKYWQPGFYHAFSNVSDPNFDTTPLVRFYWNVDVEQASALVSEITGLFNHYQMPFRFKCTNLCSLSDRLDTAVLYVSVAHFRLALQLVMEIHPRIEETLGKNVPLFTHALANGLSFAQDPPGDNSFGMDRCLRLAKAILHCVTEISDAANASARQSFSDRVIAQLQVNGLDLHKPYLTLHTNDVLSTNLEEFFHE